MEIGVTNGIRTRTTAVTGPDAAVTSWSPLLMVALQAGAAPADAARQAAVLADTPMELGRMVVAAGVEPALAAFSTPCLCQVGLRDPRLKMAERGGHAPHPDLSGTLSLPMKPGALDRFTFLGARGGTRTRTGRCLKPVPLLIGLHGQDICTGAPGRSRTGTGPDLKRPPLPIGLRERSCEESRRQDSHPHWLRSERSASANWATPGKSGGPGRTCTANLPSQSRMLC